MARHDLPDGAHEVPAECHSDDHMASATFDAAPWLKKATIKELANLVSCGFGGDYGSDEVAIWTAGRDRNVKDMFYYIEHHNENNPHQGFKSQGFESQGFECHVDKDKALSWLKAHRPDFIKALPTLMGMNRRIDELITEVAKGNQP